MSKYMAQERLQIVKIYYKNNEPVTNCLRELCGIYGRHNRPDVKTVVYMVEKFESKFTLLNVKPPNRMRKKQTEENITAVSASVTEDEKESIPGRSLELGLSQITLWHILRKDLSLHPFKILLTQELLSSDPPKCRNAMLAE
ncbi:unnamed protein product [Hermetia illucens]|uniref:DUF4817 domain-containing protein n=1 Tax=Hermetia illucens TaxID=343691 RepID=A0A7R8UND9_HERIL|nr:unnamed protein product [Hermetia illucens]